MQRAAGDADSNQHKPARPGCVDANAFSISAGPQPYHHVYATPTGHDYTGCQPVAVADPHHRPVRRVVDR